MDQNKHDDGKIRPSLIPTTALRYISDVRGFGLKKYPQTGENGWKEVGRERLLDAMLRHIINYIENPDGVDEESGLPIIAHIATNAAFLCWFDEQERQENYIPQWLGMVNSGKNVELSKAVDSCIASLMDIFTGETKTEKGDNK